MFNEEVLRAFQRMAQVVDDAARAFARITALSVQAPSAAQIEWAMRIHAARATPMARKKIRRYMRAGTRAT